MKKLLLYIVFLIGGIAIGIALQRPKEKEVVVEYVDKVVVDTIVVESPVPIKEVVLRDTIIKQVPIDRVIYRDTIIYVSMPIERKEYKTDEYYAVVKGVEPSLDYIETYTKTITKIKEVEKIRTFSPYVGGSLIVLGNYPFLGFSVGFEYNPNKYSTLDIKGGYGALYDERIKDVPMIGVNYKLKF